MSTSQIQFQLRPRRKKGEEEEPEAARQRGKRPRVAEVLALAISFDDMIRRGIARDYSDLARLGCISKERVSQIMRLVWLAPDIQQEILTLPRAPRGRFHVGEPALRQVAASRLWAEQRQLWAKLQSRENNRTSGNGLGDRRLPPDLAEVRCQAASLSPCYSPRPK